MWVRKDYGRMQVDPYPDEDDWYTRDVSIHPLQGGPEPKRRFMPSKWEEKKCAPLLKLTELMPDILMQGTLRARFFFNTCQATGG